MPEALALIYRSAVSDVDTTSPRAGNRGYGRHRKLAAPVEHIIELARVQGADLGLDAIRA